MPTAKLGDIEMYYEEKGSGEPVLLVPASWWPSGTWNVGVVPFLSRRFKTIVFDCRGTGRSGKPKDGYTVEQFAQDCIGLLAHLGVSRCHAVGFALAGRPRSVGPRHLQTRQLFDQPLDQRRLAGA